MSFFTKKADVEGDTEYSFLANVAIEEEHPEEQHTGMIGIVFDQGGDCVNSFEKMKSSQNTPESDPQAETKAISLLHQPISSTVSVQSSVMQPNSILKPKGRPPLPRLFQSKKLQPSFTPIKCNTPISMQRQSSKSSESNFQSYQQPEIDPKGAGNNHSKQIQTISTASSMQFTDISEPNRNDHSALNGKGLCLTPDDEIVKLNERQLYVKNIQTAQLIQIEKQIRFVNTRYDLLEKTWKQKYTDATRLYSNLLIQDPVIDVLYPLIELQNTILNAHITTKE